MRFVPVSKTLSPALGPGRPAASVAMAPALRAANPVAPVPPVLDRLALAAFIDRGWYDAHLRAARQRFRSRRDLLVHTLADRVPQGRASGTAAGPHILPYLPDGTGTHAAVRATSSAGLRLTDLDACRLAGSGGPALVLGYGTISDTETPPAVALLGEALSGVTAL
ncbi:hypothetical protein GCM10010327_46530 [Streptomyces nitrosporeus]|nr:hypothetical protein GCM10010327_46530 [Streptomyces nitrosporeus]